MNYEMKLYSNYFNKVKEGKKKIEIRLFDKKRRTIKIGDKITFLKLPDLSECVEVRVLDFKIYKNFEKLANDFEVIEMGFEFNTKEELINSRIIEEIYSEDEIRINGLIAFRIEKC